MFQRVGGSTKVTADPHHLLHQPQHRIRHRRRKIP
jgi:hypothetical protein